MTYAATEMKCQHHRCDKQAKWAGPAENEGLETTVIACDEHKMDGDAPVTEELAKKALEE